MPKKTKSAVKNESPSNFVCNFCQVSPPQQKQELLIFFQRSCRRDIHATMQRWKTKRLPNFGTPSDPVQQQLRHITWGLVRSRLAVKSGHPKWWKPDEHGDGGCFLIHPVPSGDEKFRFNQGSGDLLLMGCHNPLFVQNFWIYSWMDMWHVYDMISYYTTVILL